MLQARNAAEAVEAYQAQAEAVRLILADVVLPDRSGCDLALELAPRSGIRVLFMSGYPENCVTRNGLRNSGWFYLPKPFSAASLLQKVREVLSEA